MKLRKPRQEMVEYAPPFTFPETYITARLRGGEVVNLYPIAVLAKPQSTARIQMIALRGNGPVDVILRMAGDVVFSPLTFLRLVHGF